MTLIERMEQKSAPKSWIAEIKHMMADNERLGQDKEEYGLIIENLAERLTEYENDEVRVRRERRLYARMKEIPVLVDITNGAVDVYEQPAGITVIALEYDDLMDEDDMIQDDLLNVYLPDDDEWYLVHIWLG